MTEIEAELEIEDCRDLDNIIDIDVEPITIPLNLASLDDLLTEMVRGQRKIEAIKLYRSLTGFSLKEAKDAVEKCWVSKPSVDSINTDDAY